MKKILIIDDEEDLVYLMKLRLEFHEFPGNSALREHKGP